MAKIPFPLFYLLAFLESASIFYFVFAFNRIKSPLWVYFAIVAAYPFLVIAVRKLPVSFGMHSIILITFVSIFLSFYFQNSLYLSLISMVVVFAILIGSEYLMLILTSSFLEMELSGILSNNFYWFISGLPHVLIIAILGYIVRLYRS